MHVDYVHSWITEEPEEVLNVLATADRAVVISQVYLIRVCLNSHLKLNVHIYTTMRLQFHCKV